MDDAVDPRAAVGSRDLVVVDRDPGVLVRHATRRPEPVAASSGSGRRTESGWAGRPSAPSSHAAVGGRRASRPATVDSADMPTDADPRPTGRARRPATPAVHWDVRIPARDGVELSANIWRPTDADAAPVPAILEMIPYGKDNWRRNADTARGEWFAARGYALCRVDVRGTGSSGGVALDEYTGDRDRGRVRRGRVARRAAVVHRRGRDVGHQLRRVHGDPGREAPPAASPGDRAVPGAPTTAT